MAKVAAWITAELTFRTDIANEHMVSRAEDVTDAIRVELLTISIEERDFRIVAIDRKDEYDWSTAQAVLENEHAHGIGNAWRAYNEMKVRVGAGEVRSYAQRAQEEVDARDEWNALVSVS